MSLFKFASSFLPKCRSLLPTTAVVKTLTSPKKPSVVYSYRHMSGQVDKKEVVKLSKKEKMRKAVMEYGPIFIAFHVTISLTSLGISYLIVKSLGSERLEELFVAFGVSKDSFLASVGTFGVAYAVHKSMAALRIAISLFFVPLIVRVLKNKGMMKYVDGKLVFTQSTSRRMR